MKAMRILFWLLLCAAQPALADALDIRTFGAKCDGSTDDSIAAQALLTSGQDAIIPAGKTCVVAGLTAATASQRISGTGTLKLKNAANVTLLTINAHGVVISGVQFDGNKANQTTVDDVLGSVLYVNDGKNNTEIRDTVILNAKRNGIAGFGNSTGAKYVGNRIDSPGFIGIFPSSGSTRPWSYGVIADNYITSPGQDGIGTVAMQYSAIVGNRIYFPVVAGIALEASNKATTVSGNTVIGNAAVGSGTTTCIQVNDSQSITVSGNAVAKCQTGIAIAGDVTSKNVTVSGNSVEDAGYADAAISVTTSVAGSYLAAYKYGVNVVGNVINNAPYAGILINGVQGAIVSGNTIQGFNLQSDNVINRHLGAIVLRNFAHNNVVDENRITDATGGALKAGIIEVNDGSASPAKNTYRDNQIAGLNQDICVTAHGTDQSLVARPAMSTAAPAANTWLRGQIQYHAFPASGGNIGWVSTDAKGGSFSTYASTGSITIGTATLTVASTDGLFEGMALSVAGAITGETIVLINRTTKVVTLSGNASASVAGAAVTPYNPTFKTWGVIA